MICTRKLLSNPVPITARLIKEGLNHFQFLTELEKRVKAVNVHIVARGQV